MSDNPNTTIPPAGSVEPAATDQGTAPSPGPVLRAVGSLVQKTRRALSPWIRQRLEARAPETESRIPAVTTQNTRELLRRVRARTDRAVVWKPDIGPLQPELIRRFSGDVARRMQTLHLISRPVSRTPEVTWNDDLELTLPAGPAAAPETPSTRKTIQGPSVFTIGQPIEPFVPKSPAVRPSRTAPAARPARPLARPQPPQRSRLYTRVEEFQPGGVEPVAPILTQPQASDQPRPIPPAAEPPVTVPEAAESATPAAQQSATPPAQTPPAASPTAPERPAPVAPLRIQRRPAPDARPRPPAARPVPPQRTPVQFPAARREEDIPATPATSTIETPPPAQPVVAAEESAPHAELPAPERATSEPAPRGRATTLPTETAAAPTTPPPVEPPTLAPVPVVQRVPPPPAPPSPAPGSIERAASQPEMPAASRERSYAPVAPPRATPVQRADAPAPQPALRPAPTPPSAARPPAPTPPPAATPRIPVEPSTPERPARAQTPPTAAPSAPFPATSLQPQQAQPPSPVEAASQRPVATPEALPMTVPASRPPVAVMPQAPDETPVPASQAPETLAGPAAALDSPEMPLARTIRSRAASRERGLIRRPVSPAIKWATGLRTPAAVARRATVQKRAAEQLHPPSMWSAALPPGMVAGSPTMRSAPLREPDGSAPTLYARSPALYIGPGPAPLVSRPAARSQRAEAAPARKSTFPPAPMDVQAASNAPAPRAAAFSPPALARPASVQAQTGARTPSWSSEIPRPAAIEAVFPADDTLPLVQPPVPITPEPVARPAPPLVEAVASVGPSVTGTLVQRETDETAEVEEGDLIDMSELARKVYPFIKRLITVERERRV